VERAGRGRAVLNETVDCVDVRTLPGRWKIERTSDASDRGPLQPWYIALLCKYGTITAHGGTKLQAFVARSPTSEIGQRLLALECVSLWQGGDKEFTAVFEAALFERVAAVIRPRRRKVGRPGLADLGRRAIESLRTAKPDSGTEPDTEFDAEDAAGDAENRRSTTNPTHDQDEDEVEDSGAVETSPQGDTTLPGEE
jgi:hypothetical protein